MGFREANRAEPLTVKIGDAALTAKYALDAREAAASAAASAVSAEAAAGSAAAAAETSVHPPVPGENGNWWIWDQNSGCYVDSGKTYRGEKGDTGPQGVQGPQGEVTAEQFSTVLKQYESAEASGGCAAFEADAADLPLKSVLVSITPVQSGSGDPGSDNVRTLSGWTGCNVTQAGKNLGNFMNGKGINSNGNIVNTTGRCATVDPIKIDPGKSYTVSHQSDSDKLFICSVFNGNTLVRRTGGIVSGTVLDTSGGTKMYVCLYNVNALSTVSVEIDKPMVETGTVTSAYEPYVGVSAGISWLSRAGTVYAGSFDVLTGELKARPYYSSYNGETLVGPWISDRDVYAAGTSPTSGAQVVDLGGTETVCQLTPHEIATLSGKNNIWADCGNVSVTFGAYLAAVKDYSDRLGDSIRRAIAPVETGAAASRAFAQGAYFFRGDQFCKAKTAIASGAAFTLGTNYEVTTVAAVLAALQ